MLEFRNKIGGAGILVFADNGVFVGDIYEEIDGYFVFWPESDRAGFWEAYYLREIADKLDDMNKEWDEIVRKDMEKMSGPVMPKWFAVLCLAIYYITKVLGSWWFWFTALLLAATILRYKGII